MAPIAVLNNPSPAQYDYFGSGVAISGKSVFVGAYGDDTGAPDTGSAYVYDLNSADPLTPIATLANPTPDPHDEFGLSIAVSGNSIVVGAPADSNQNYDQGAAYVYALTPSSHLASIVVNKGAVQRSMVAEMAVTFDSKVTFTGSPEAAFSLVNLKTGVPVMLSAAIDNSGTGTVVTLTFVGGSVDLGGSLADGRYELQIHANQFGGGGFDGNGNGWPGDDYTLIGDPATNKLFRLFADINGDGDVDSQDFLAFRTAAGTATGQPSFDAAFDFDGDGDVDAFDFLRFRARFGTVVP